MNGELGICRRWQIKFLNIKRSKIIPDNVFTCSIIWYNSTERYIERLDTRLQYTFNQIIVYIVASNKMLISSLNCFKSTKLLLAHLN